MIAISGHRINANIDYALSQRNNHGISEGTALWTIGVLFPELISSEEWERKGREVLEKLGCELIYVDGAFSQQSLNYQRLMLQLYLWCIRLGDLVERPFSHELRQKVGASGNLLYQVQFGLNGEVPTYGQNDGALILPLNNCDYTDYRPIIQAIHYLVHGTRCYEAGPWDEDLFWLFGDDGLTAPVALDRRTDWHSENSGYFVWRTKESSIFTRCGELRDRPAQADMLHVDLWWKGLNIAIDPGTYSYNEQPPWDNNPLGATRFHNSVTVDKQEQMERFGRFMWLPWVSGKEELNQQAFGGELSFWQGSHNGFLRLPDAVSYQRGIIRFDDEVWMIFDWLRGGQKHDYRLHWLFANWPYKWDVQKNNLILETPQGNYSARVGTVNKTDLESSIVNADTIANRGWRCQYYHKREPAISLEVIGRDTSIGFWTLFAPSDVQVNVNKYSVSNNSIDMEVKSVEWQATIIFHADLSLKSIVLNERSGFNQRLNIIS